MESTDLLREFCAENATDLAAAIAAGARRIELCDNLAVGGTTPSFGVIDAAVSLAHERGARVMTMIRPRGGGFVYTEAEVAMMEADARIALALGSDGVVLGCLAPAGDGALALDRAALERVVAIAREASAERGEAVDLTFHMAFDALPAERQLEALDELVELGFTRVLTHGGPAGTPIEDNVPRLRELIDHAAGRLIILPGAGITHRNAAQIAEELGVREVHGTKIVDMG